MPYTQKKTTKAGKEYYEIQVRRGRGKSTLSRRWYVPDGWSERAIQRELAAVAAKFEQECRSGEVLSRKEVKELKDSQASEAAKIKTLQQYGEEIFMPAKAIEISENGRSSYQRTLDNQVYPALGKIKMPEITPAQISALLLSFQEKGLAHASVIKIYSVLSSLFKMAYLSDVIERNPMDKVQRPKPRKDEVKEAAPQAYTAEEVKRIYECLENEPLKWRAMIHLLIDTGVRRGECCALRWEDVDFTTGEITVLRNACYTPSKGIYIDTPKNSHARTVFVGKGTLELLKQLQEQQREICESEWVFSQDNSPEVMHPQSPTRYLKKFSEKYSVPDLHPHKLRHTFASIAITNGADVASVSEVLGHSDSAVTLRMYTHSNQERKSRAAQIVREAISGSGDSKN